MRAAIYVRISLDRKVNGEYTMLGVDRQREDCEELCRTLGWEVARVFVDNDVSAVSKKARPAYQQLLQACRDEEVDAIVCWHPDRLYRKTVDLEELIGVCDKHRVPVATCNAGAVDLTTPTGRLVAGLLAQVARYEGEHKAERWRRGYDQRRLSGTPSVCGPRLYGYTRDGVVVDEEAKVIRHWVARVMAGDTLYLLMKEAAAAGLRTTRGNLWRANSIKTLLGNPRLAGWVTLRGKPVARSEWEPILTEEESETVRALVNARKVGRAVYPRVATLKGVAKCGVCGSTLMTGRRQTGKRSYRCPSVRGYGSGCVEIAAEQFEVIVEEYARLRLSDPNVRVELARVRSEKSGGVKEAQEVIALEARLRAIDEQLVESDIDVGALMRARRAVVERIEEAQKRITSAGASLAIPIEAEVTWPEDVAKRNLLIALVVESAWVDPQPGGGGFRKERIRIEPRLAALV